LNDYTEAQEASVRAVIESECTYGVYGHEIAPKTGTPHLQGYVEFSSPKTKTAAIAILPGCWVDMRRGTPSQAAEYCKKTDTEGYWEHGIPPKRSDYRSDLDMIRKTIGEGKPLNSIVDNVGYQAAKYAKLMLKYDEKQRDWKPIVTWIYGPTGSGKATMARQLSPDAWISGKSLKWWDGYDAHENVILENFRAVGCEYHALLRTLDRYPYSVPIKRGFRELLARQIIITAPCLPHEVYKKETDLSQLLRRIDFIIRMDTDHNMHYEKEPEQEATSSELDQAEEVGESNS
jgi:hypothetical protein